MTYFKLKPILFSLTIYFLVGSDAVDEPPKDVPNIGYLYDRPTQSLESAPENNKNLSDGLLSKEYLHPKDNLNNPRGENPSGMEGNLKQSNETQSNQENQNGVKIDVRRGTRN